MEAKVSCRDWETPRTVTVDDGAPVKVLVESVGLHAHATLVLKDGKPVPDNSLVEEGGEYEVIPVASGG